MTFGKTSDTNWTRAVQRTQKLQETFKGKPFFVGAVVDDSDSKTVEQWMTKNKLSLPVGMELKDKQGQSRYSIKSLPCTIVIDTRRTIVYRFDGVSEAMERKMTETVKKSLE